MAKGPRLVTLIPIRKMNRAIKFYTGSLGARVLYRGRGSMKNFWAGLKLGGVDVWFVAPEKWEKRTLSYTTLLVGDIRRTVRGLQRKGVKFQRAERASKETRVEGPIAFEPFGASAFFKDTEGNLLMIWQNNPPM